MLKRIRRGLSAVEAIEEFELNMSKMSNLSKKEIDFLLQWAMVKSLHSGRPVLNILSNIEKRIASGKTLSDVEKWFPGV